MALPGKHNPFERGLTEKPPVSGSVKKTFTKIPLSTGLPVQKTSQPNPQEAPTGPDSDLKNSQDEPDSPETNRGQSEDKLETNRGQSEDKLETNRGQSGDSPVEVKNETEDKLGTKPRTQPETNRGQSGDKLETNPLVSSLVGLQRDVLFYCYESCKRTRSKKTEQLVLANISESLGNSSSSIKKTIQRLEKKLFLYREAFKNGRSGWTVYEIPDLVYQDLLQLETEDKVRTNRGQTRDKLGTKLETEPRTSASSSSSSSSLSDNKTTTTEEPQIGDKTKQDLPPEWEAIDFNDLSEIHFGRPQLKQWCDRKYCSAEQAQESIYHFAFYLKHAKKGEIKTGPLNFFMGIMAKQHYFPRPDGYLSPEEEGMKRRAEDLRKKNDSLTMIERDLYDYAFDIWFRSLTEDEIQILVPNIFNYEPRKGALRGVFLDKYWLKFKSNPHLDPARLGKSEDQQGREVSSKHEELSPEEIKRIADQQFGSVQVQEVSSS